MTGNDEYIRNRVEELPEDRRVLITAHDAFQYFGNGYGFQVRGLQGISTDAEAGTSDIRNLADFIVEREIGAIFVESSVPARNIEALQEAVKARGFDVKIGGELYSDSTGSLGTEAETYIGTVKHNIGTIVDALLGIVSGVLGNFAVIRKESLLGDAVSHAALPGIALAFLFTQSKNTEILLLGALISGLLATFLILGISKYSRIKFDSALALILSVFFGAGLVLLTYIQKTPNADQAGLSTFIFGQASTLLLRDVKIMATLGIVLLSLVILFWKEFKIVSFDAAFAESLGFNTRLITILLSALIVIAIIIGLQTVGVILMSAMITAPGVAARQWTDKFSLMIVLAGIFGAISGIGGTLISSLGSQLPTGPMIVVIVSVIVFVSITLAPNRGLVWKYFRGKNNVESINEDQLLINLYRLAINHHDRRGHDISTINPTHKLNKSAKLKVERQLKHLNQKGLAQIDKNDSDKWFITKKGMDYIDNYFKEEGI